MKLWFNTLLRLLVGSYFVLTSLYCILAFLPYTYTALIKAPPYAWMPWFAHHQASLYWIAAAAAAICYKENFKVKDKRFFVGVCILTLGGICLSVRPFLPALESNLAAYWWSLAALAWISGLLLWQAIGGTSLHDDPAKPALFGYSDGLLTAAAVSLIYFVGAHVNIYRQSGSLIFHYADAELGLWSLLSHFVVAVAALSILNLIRLVAARTPWPGISTRVLTGVAIAIGLWLVLARFLDSAMSFDGWRAQLYAASLAATLTLLGFSLVLPFLNAAPKDSQSPAISVAWRKTAIWSAIVVLTVIALASRSLIGGEDWNGFVNGTWALIFWIALSLCVYRLRPVRATYSPAIVITVLLVSIVAYRGLLATEILWGKPLGSTDDEISLKLEEYGGRDASFQLAHHVLGNGRNEKCGDLCRILREYSNIRDAHIRSGVQLVDDMKPSSGERPNIFIFVIDSMRPDYLGAYNPQHVNYTPNLDSLARDSVVFKNVYTQYAGTSLSEPAIWSGSLLLHAHFPQPFDKVNSLYKLARVDGYQTVLSYDSVLRQLFGASDNLVKLDQDERPWNELEIASTLQQLESTLDGRRDKSQPILFYTQPMNVHQFARNNVPSPSSQHWQSPAGLNGRISYEVHWVDSCLGQFFGYLKQRNLYDNSIIVVTSDHGDATGEFGRVSHSATIWPEIMHVPLIVHLPPQMRSHLVFDENRLSTLTDITPTLYYLLGHKPIRQNSLYGRPLFAQTKEELEQYRHGDIFLASDLHAVYGILTADGRHLYTTYDSPAESYLFDLATDPNARHNVVTPALKQRYDEEIIEQLQTIGDFYGYKPGVGSLLASTGANH